MMTFLSEYFSEHGISLWSPIPLGECKIGRGYLLEREGLSNVGTVVMLAIPYVTPACFSPDRNLSAYAVSKDYHLFFKSLFSDLLPRLREKFPNEIFAGFADHSPIDERDASCRAGLGVIGENGMLITKPYSSYVFLGEIITSVIVPCQAGPLTHCEKCGACRKFCPFPEIGNCLSALTQKKGSLTEDEENAILRYGSLWGCDICQEVCPHTKKAVKDGTIFSPIPFFAENPIPKLTLEILDAMSDEEFSSRAYAWRKRETIRRNLELFEKKGAEKC